MSATRLHATLGNLTLNGRNAKFLEWAKPKLTPKGLSKEYVTLRELVAFAPYVCRVEPVRDEPFGPSLDFRFKTVGSHVDEWYAESLTGKQISNLDLGEWADHWIGEYRAVADLSQIRMGLVPIEWQERGYLNVSYIYVPVFDEDGSVTEVLTFTEFYMGDCPSSTQVALPQNEPNKPTFMTFGFSS